MLEPGWVHGAEGLEVLSFIMARKRKVTYLREVEIKYKPIRIKGEISTTRITGPETVAHLFQDL